MKFPYLVKHNGVYYKAGEEVPVEDTQSPSVTEVSKPNLSENAKDEEVIVESKKTFKLSKTEVNRLNTADLQKMASEYGFDSTLSGSKLKQLFIKEFGL